MPSRNVHVLFLHGVGQHSHLTSLLQAYQAIRSNVRSPESPIPYEDPIPDWRLAEFDDSAAPSFLKLEPRYPGVQSGPADGVYLYEVNYSALAGVIRANHPLDITRLFVGFDLAANFARTRLLSEPPLAPPAGGFNIDHLALSQEVQKLAGVMVAATVPILGLPSRLLRNYTGTFVSTFTRFFEDVATFAMDKNGEQLISAHVDRVVKRIVESPRFKKSEAEFGDDVFVMVAHSLGAVVAHNYLARYWPGGGKLPDRLLTFGSPIGLVCWLWLFLDFPRLEFGPEQPSGDNYFCWTPEAGAGGPLRAFAWINVMNHLDPIAAAFPLAYVNLALPPQNNAAGLVGGSAHHRFMKTGGMLAAGRAHTAYFDDRDGFLEIVGRFAELRPGSAVEPCTERDGDRHWRESLADLLRLRLLFWAAGAFAVVAYLAAIGRALDSAWPFALLPLYLVPRLTIGGLAFFQRLFFGWPTKRTSLERILGLRWRDWSALPYRLRRKLGLSRSDPEPLASAPGWLASLARGVVSFLPTAVVMATPVLLVYVVPGSELKLARLVWDNLLATLGIFAIFVAYLVFFAGSEFFRYWRSALGIVIRTQ